MCRSASRQMSYSTCALRGSEAPPSDTPREASSSASSIVPRTMATHARSPIGFPTRTSEQPLPPHSRMASAQAPTKETRVKGSALSLLQPHSPCCDNQCTLPRSSGRNSADLARCRSDKLPRKRWSMKINCRRAVA